ncbi:MAG: 2Fe-2S iron-sulfur cluster-binding protein [Actinomycetota bacterium]
MSTTEPPPSRPAPAEIVLTVNGTEVRVPDLGESLLAVLRERLGVRSVKDGCSPQGQCGCCTVLVDGQPRVACVTPVRRVRGRTVTTLEGLEPERVARWGDALCAAGGSQCGYCTPGIVVRLDSVARKAPAADDGRAAGSKTVGSKTADSQTDDAQVAASGRWPEVDQALLAHLCRCTGWQTIHEAWERFVADGPIEGGDRDLDAASERATIEGRSPQGVSPAVALGQGGFAADEAPGDSLIAVADGAGGWVVAETLTEARALAGKVQGRRTTARHEWPLEIPDGRWDAALRTTWVDGAYLETDASWCVPGGTLASVVANGGAFGAKTDGPPPGALDVGAVARELADIHGQPVLVLASREDVAARSPKRPPVAGGMMADGTGLLRVVATPGIAEAVASVAPGLIIEEVAVPGPPTSAAVRAAGWAEAAVLTAGATGRAGPVRSPEGAVAEAVVEDGTIKVTVGCGRVLDPVVLRSYCIGAAHMAWSWLTSEATQVDADGQVHDLTVRSFGVLRAVDTPPIEVEILPGDGAPVNGSDAVFAAVAAAGWLANDCRPDWPLIADTPRTRSTS